MPTTVQLTFLRPRLDCIFQLAEKKISQQESSYIAGDTLTAADISIIYSFDAAMNRMPVVPSGENECWSAVLNNVL